MNSWPDFIKAIKKDMSYQWLADNLGVSKGWLLTWVNGRKGQERRPPPSKYWPDFITLATAAGLKVDADYLLKLK